MSLIFLEHYVVTVTVQLPDGSLVKKAIDDIQPDDMLVFDDRPGLEYRPQPMVWDFD